MHFALFGRPPPPFPPSAGERADLALASRRPTCRVRSDGWLAAPTEESISRKVLPTHSSINSYLIHTVHKISHLLGVISRQFFFFFFSRQNGGGVKKCRALCLCMEMPRAVSTYGKVSPSIFPEQPCPFRCGVPPAGGSGEKLGSVNSSQGECVLSYHPCDTVHK